MITIGGASIDTTQPVNASANPEKPRKRTKIVTPQISEKIMTVSLAVSIRLSAMGLRPAPRKTATAKMMPAPSAPASVGVAQPW